MSHARVSAFAQLRSDVLTKLIMSGSNAMLCYERVHHLGSSSLTHRLRSFHRSTLVTLKVAMAFVASVTVKLGTAAWSWRRRARRACK